MRLNFLFRNGEILYSFVNILTYRLEEFQVTGWEDIFFQQEETEAEHTITDKTISDVTEVTKQKICIAMESQLRQLAKLSVPKKCGQFCNAVQLHSHYHGTALVFTCARFCISW